MKSVFSIKNGYLKIDDKDVDNAISEESDMTLAKIYIKLSKLILLSFRANKQNTGLYYFDKTTTLYTLISFKFLGSDIYETFKNQIIFLNNLKLNDKGYE